MKLLGFKNGMSSGRLCMLMSVVCGAFITQLTSGIFYTSFLLCYGIGTRGITLIMLAPYIAGLLGFVSPYLLEKVRSKKYILALFKLAGYFVNILGFMYLPIIVKSAEGRISGLFLLTTVGGIFNAVANSGYSAWFLTFLPDNVRPAYFSMSKTVSFSFNAVFLLVSGYVTDLLTKSGNLLSILTIMRYIACVLTVTDVIILLLPPENNRDSIAREVRLSDVLLIPTSDRRFILTMLIPYTDSIAAGTYSSVLSVYLIKTVRISYLYNNAATAAFALFLLVFSPFFCKMIRRYSWLTVYNASLVLFASFNMLYPLVNNANYLIMLTAIKAVQHFAGVGSNITTDNMQYLNMPRENRTFYSSFYYITVIGGWLVGILLSLSLQALTGGGEIILFGRSFGSMELLIIAGSLIHIAEAVYISLMKKQIE